MELREVRPGVSAAILIGLAGTVLNVVGLYCCSGILEPEHATKTQWVLKVGWGVFSFPCLSALAVQEKLTGRTVEGLGAVALVSNPFVWGITGFVVTRWMDWRPRNRLP